MSTTVWFTPSTARSVIASGPLVFGDLTAIAALAYLRDLAAARRIVAECECEPCVWCEGAGDVGPTKLAKFNGESIGLCWECGGNGTLYCRCYAGLNRFAVVQARRDLLARLRRDDRKLRRAG